MNNQLFDVRTIIQESVSGRTDITENDIDSWVNEIEEMFDLQQGNPAITIELAALAANGDVDAISSFDRWGCIRCVSANIALGAAILAAIVAFGPTTPGVVAYIAAKFVISETLAASLIGATSGAVIAKKLCGNC